MILRPASLDELVDGLRQAHARRERLTAFDLASLNRVVDYAPEDMTVTVQSGLNLAVLQQQLAQRRQWLPIDPPHPERTSIGAILAANQSGPRRLGWGAVREHLIGIQVALADGRLIKAGGKVVKNVAGYDLAKLFVGSRGSLGVIVEATFKLRPLPEAEQFVQARCDTLDQATDLVQQVMASDLTPVVLDLHNLALPEVVPSPALSVIVGLAGTHREVEHQLQQARQLGLNEPGDLRHEAVFWRAARWDDTNRMSVLPSALPRALRALGNTAFVARAGNGLVFFRGAPVARTADVPQPLLQRLKDAYDPQHIFPDLPL